MESTATSKRDGVLNSTKWPVFAKERKNAIQTCDCAEKTLREPRSPLEEKTSHGKHPPRFRVLRAVFAKTP